MKTMPVVKATILRTIFLLTLIVSVSSCKKNNSVESSIKNEAFAKNEKEEIEAFFFIATANVSQTIISKSQIAQQKSSDSTVQEVSKRIEIQQNQLLQEITKLANKKLIIITEINSTHKRALYDLIDADEISFNQTYLNSIQESLHEEINFLESISKETNDQTILKLVLQYLPEQYQFLRETEKIKKVII